MNLRSCSGGLRRDARCQIIVVFDNTDVRGCLIIESRGGEVGFAFDISQSVIEHGQFERAIPQNWLD